MPEAEGKARNGIIRRHPVVAYFALTFVLSWIGALLVALPRLLRREELPELTGILMFPAMLLGPSIAGIVMNWVLDGRAGLVNLAAGLRHWRVGRWYAALLIPPALVLGVLTCLRVLVSPAFTPNLFWMGILFGIPAGFLEEIGWTGFAFPRMRASMGGTRAAIVLGVVWSIWHVPVINWLGTKTPHGRYWLPFFLAFGLAMTAMRVLIGWLYSNTGSVLLAQLMHVSSTGALVVFSAPRVTGAQEVAWYALYGAALWALVVAGLRPSGRLALLLIVAGISSNSFGTTVVVLIRDNNVWMAADSRQGDASGTRRYGCQIGQGKDFYWASASPGDEAPAFHIDQAMKRIQASDGTLLERMKALIEKSKIPITEQLEKLRAADQKRFQTLMKVANHDLVKIVFVGIEKHVPTVVWATLVAEEQAGRIVVSTDTLKSVIPAEVRDGVVGAGRTKEALEYLGAHHWETGADPVPLLRESLQAEAGPHAASGTISVLRFSETGAEWVDRGKCNQLDSGKSVTGR